MKRRPKTTIITTIITAGLLAAVMTPGVATADEIRDGQWYLDTLGIHQAHELSQGAGVTIGVIDSGIDPSHVDIDGKVLPGADLVYEDRDGLTDDSGHGTAVASILVGDNDTNGVLGIAPEATILSVNLFRDDAKTSDPLLMAPAIEWLIDNGADIITTSVGGGGDNASQDAIDRAHDNGIPVVASVSNRYADVGRGREEQVGTGFPASQPRVIPVTGTTAEGSAWDGSLDLSMASAQRRLGVSAPAVDIPIALPGNNYDTVNGNSLAAPIVTGTLALIKSAYPDLDYQTMVARMVETVDDKGPEGYDYEYGWGIVNPLAALTEDVVFDDEYSSIESYADDRLPLEEQGKQTGNDDDGSAPGDNGDNPADDDEQALTAINTGLPLWVWITIAATTTILTAAIATTLLLRRRNRNKASPLSLQTAPPIPPSASSHVQFPSKPMAPPQSARPPTGQEARPQDHQ